MGLWHNKRTRIPALGKFRSVARAGIQRSAGHHHRGWAYHLVRHRTGTTVQRQVYHATVVDPQGNRVAYLTDFTSAARASAAAREWIDQHAESVTVAKTPGDTKELERQTHRALEIYATAARSGSRGS